MPARASNASSHTPYSSEVRCAEVARRQTPRQSVPSCTAKTILVLPASMTSNMVFLFPSGLAEQNLARADRLDTIFVPQQQFTLVGQACKAAPQFAPRAAHSERGAHRV